jgi:uncharacterized protein (DUF1778 family)
MRRKKELSQLHVRLSEEELSLIQQAAALERRSQSKWAAIELVIVAKKRVAKLSRETA